MMRNILLVIIIVTLFSNSFIFAQEKVVESPISIDRGNHNLNRVQNTPNLHRYMFGASSIINASDNGTYRVFATAGQTVIGSQQVGSNWIFSGFWVPVDTSSTLGNITIVKPDAEDSWVVGESQTIEWQSNEFVDSVHILISRNNSIDWDILFSNISGSNSQKWIAAMPRSDGCHIKIISVQDNKVYAISNKYSIVPEETNGLTKDEKQPSGTTQDAYRLISVPILLKAPRPGNVLVDELGAYDNTKWRFFDYIDGRYIEFDNTATKIREFIPGRSFFLIAKDGATIVAGAGELVADSVVYVPLTKGWNYIANPYLFEIPISSISHSDGLHTYTSTGWEQISSTDMLKPWEGYSVYVDDTTTLEIRLPNPGSSPQKINIPPETGWTIRITAQCQKTIDQHNYIGTRNDASNTWDCYDRLKPPPIGDYVRVYFPHRNWVHKANIYSADFRPEDNEIYSWDLEVDCNIEDMITLTFEELSGLPAHFDFWILNKTHKLIQNLQKNNKYQVMNFKKGQDHQLTLLVGDNNLLQPKLDDADIVPTQFEVFENFPNPFNAATAIRYSLPKPQRVTIKIFNIFGQEVTSLLERDFRETGFHIEYWDGRNLFGQPVTSGVYLYSFHTNEFSKINKMLLIK
jgi:hypothetical protein